MGAKYSSVPHKSMGQIIIMMMVMMKMMMMMLMMMMMMTTMMLFSVVRTPYFTRG